MLSWNLSGKTKRILQNAKINFTILLRMKFYEVAVKKSKDSVKVISV
jgi:hypothetical protein